MERSRALQAQILPKQYRCEDKGYLDYMSVMAYDFFGSWNSYTGHCSPLGAREHGSEEERTLNVASVIWLV